MAKYIFCFIGIVTFFWSITGCAQATEAPPIIPATVTIAPSATSLPTATPIPPTATPTLEPSEVFELPDFPLRISVRIPDAVASIADSKVIPLGREDTPTRQDIPRHALITLDNYPGPTIEYQGPAIRVFTVAGLELGYGFQVNKARQAINGEVPDSGIYPALPIVSGPTTLQIRLKPLAFQNGKGFRYLESESTPTLADLNNLDNQYMNYIYQGITQDGKYYVSVILPVKLPFLVEAIGVVATQVAANPTPLPQEILFLPFLAKLQTADDTEFLPSLAVLDEIVSSIEVTAP